ncbi:MAG TPA: plastocyanin/azurin family copper-binding protein [Solirubrobacterales bacterium]|nr:plastocyanin/azurin family copper-binding protein [Solirubrobacterales bacterium]
MSGRRILSLPLLIACTLVLAPNALASNTRVSISNYAWAPKQVHIDLDEKVTWDWLGPDLAHSVTGTSANARQWDSDPNTDAPYHRPGFSYTIQFTQPGAYSFICKLHPFVRGEVIVSSNPGDPNSDPGPQAPLRIDVKKPTLSKVTLKSTRFSGSKGVGMSAKLSEGGSLEAEYYRTGAGGKRSYSGYAEWKVSGGINRLKLGARWKHFKAAPGRYEAVLRATDRAANPSKPVARNFTIVPGG